MNNELIKAAQAVVDRWDSTDWKAPPTAEVMDGLRNALAELSRREDRFVFVADLPVEALIYAALLLRLDTGNIESVVNSKTVSEYEREISRLVESARAAQQENKQ
jgi:hypothetical protein